jgi:hypothetical protein
MRFDRKAEQRGFPAYIAQLDRTAAGARRRRRQRSPESVPAVSMTLA